MRKFRIVFYDPNGVLDAQELEIHASSFPAAYVTSCSYLEHFDGLSLRLIELLD